MASILSSLFGKQYTIGELMRIDADRQDRASGCMVKLIKTYYELKRESVLDKFKSFFLNKNLVNVYYVIFKFNVVSGTGGSHTVIVKANPDFNLTNWQNNKVKVFCSCNDFKYRSSYLLNKNDSLFLNDKVKIELGQALSDAPKAKSKTTLLCKHSFAALDWLIGNYSSVMKTI